MDIGPDGSLCRITSSAKDCVNNIQIVKVSEDELQISNGPPYKLVLIGKVNNDCESLSEKSDEDVSEAEKINLTELKSKNIEKEKVIKFEEVDKKLKPHSKKCTIKPYSNRHRSNHTQRNRKNYNYRGTRNYYPPDNVTESFSRPMANTSSNGISPWLNQSNIPHMYQNYSHYSHVNVPLLKSVNSNVDTFGPFSDYPQSSPFQQRNIQSNNQSNSFAHSQGYWNREYIPNYQRSVQDMPNSSKRGCGSYYANKHQKHKGREKRFWQKNQNRNHF